MMQYGKTKTHVKCFIFKLQIMRIYLKKLRTNLLSIAKSIPCCNSISEILIHVREEGIMQLCSNNPSVFADPISKNFLPWANYIFSFINFSLF